MKMKKKLIKIYRFAEKNLSGHGLGKILPTQSISRKMFRILRSSYCTYEGCDFYIGKEDTAGYSVNDFEYFERSVMKKHIKKGDIVLDIGANIGFYTVLFSKWVGETGRVYAFEPDKTNFKILKLNVKKNNCKNVILYNLAVYSKNKTLNFYLSPKLGEHSLIPEFYTKITKVKVATVDSLIKTKIDFIKMDIEGSEAHALKGMKKLIEMNNEMKMFLEYSPYLIRRSGLKPKSFLKQLEKDFKLYWVNNPKKRVMPLNKEFRKTFLENNKLLKNNTTNQTNILCIKKENKTKR